MKIVAGLGSIEEYIPYVEAGADELFCGYVPFWWNEKYGTFSPLNRREVLAYQVQIGAFEDLKILGNLVKTYGVPVTIALNALSYSKEQYSEIAAIVKSCMEIGYDSFILADPALVLFLREKGIGCKIQLSGEMSEVNSLFLKEMAQYDIARVIFHRKNSFSDMKSCIQNTKDVIPEYEAFVLNEMCHFTGAYCNSLHCDELAHLCKVPYQLGRYDESVNTVYRIQKMSASADGCDTETDDCMAGIEGYVTGATGCGLCALTSLQAAGVTHLKVVGRGNYVDYEAEDIRRLKKALTMLEEAEKKSLDDLQFSEMIQTELFQGKCSHNCYYRNDLNV